MDTVALDTSALMMPVECDVRLLEELERVLGRSIDDVDLVVPETVLAELRRLAEGSGEAATAASVGLDLALEHGRVVETDSTVADDALVEMAAGEADYVVTNDLPLRDRVLDRGCRAIGLRGRNKLGIIEP